MSSKQKNLFFIVVILAMVLFYTLSGGSVGISLDFGEEVLTVSAEKFDHIIPYGDVENLELISLPAPGTLLEGADKRSLRYGVWENEQWGEYLQCVTPKVDQCILITMESGEVFLLNYQDAESTAALHKMFTELLQSKGIL